MKWLRPVSDEEKCTEMEMISVMWPSVEAKLGGVVVTGGFILPF